jgi:hypothetical protein
MVFVNASHFILVRIDNVPITGSTVLLLAAQNIPKIKYILVNAVQMSLVNIL